MFTRLIIFSLFILTTHFAVADTFACPSKFGYIQTGDSMEAVIHICGSPTQQINLAEKTPAHQITEWNYVNGDLPIQKFTVLFEKSQVIGIRLYGNLVITNTACPHGNIGANDSSQEVEKSCGKPAEIHTITRNPSEQKIMVKLIYQPEKYLPATTFIFTDGKLTGKQ